MLTVANRLPGIALGLLRADGVRTHPVPATLEEALARLLRDRPPPLPPEVEATRLAARDMLRHGRYKPTGRGTPASDYLLRSATDGAFPRINALVDACNLVSLRYLLPISIWDLDRAATDRFVFRLGRADEAYVFNTAGQEIALEDLAVGCRIGVDDPPEGTPIVNPVKDSMATKTQDGSTRVGASIYAPADALDLLAEATAWFADLLAACGEAPAVAHAVAAPGGDVQV